MSNDEGTYEQILRLIVERGPITAGELAKILVLTPAAVRRHLGVLVDDKFIEEYDGPKKGPVRRGRPSRQYVATAEGQGQLGQGYSDLASNALAFVQDSLGDEGLEQFITARAKSLEKRYSEILNDAGSTPAERAAALTDALSRDGYVATLRRGGPNALSVQICQGHCPVHEVAEEFPLLCEAETEAFARLLGVPIQRLSTIASGGHVCTTNIPLGIPRNLRARSRQSARSAKRDSTTPPSGGVSEGN
ncbi:helix-turn-helix transcriptional regulator [Trueperella bialowiezensis]|uniref:Iron-sulfur cluster biosynthesis transcriptional regulator SufR n=1 Tax=Trueperella bialowiezensis TaxID=312285 RepID=A0A448PBH6_9ACTO|nr:helix-turn-helix domain-containing protein [Trueperella bialowiezensis]VEI12339.1 iron-sulfur cluster biosynthesis transcriptional regulator SufR [Trueperella bialowiezensis]